MSAVLAMGLRAAPLHNMAADGAALIPPPTLAGSQSSTSSPNSVAAPLAASPGGGGDVDGSCSCPHLALHMNDETYHSYQTICAYSLRWRQRQNLPAPSEISRAISDTSAAVSSAQRKLVDSALSVAEQWRRLPVPLCHGCGTGGNRLHACLHCVFLGCRGPRNDLHLHMQAREHRFAVDFLNLAIYCNECGDYTYELVFDEILLAETARLHESLARIREPLQPQHGFSVWRPTAHEEKLLKSDALLHMGHMGLRGLRNLGATCFMNSILQTFLHNPLLRTYFMSDQHNKELCGNERARCLACQVDNLFANVYGGESTPFVPNEFLWSMWMSCSQLVGYAQQDAHEFFIGALNGIHSDLEKFPPPNSKSPSRHSGADVTAVDPHACHCVIHRVFSGLFESRVTCLLCGNQNMVCDPFLDISLDIRPLTAAVLASPMFVDGVGPPLASSATKVEHPVTTMAIAPSELSGIITEAKVPTPVQLVKPARATNALLPPPVNTKGHDAFLTLYECLDLFTHQERLSTAEYKCSACVNSARDGIKPHAPHSRIAGATKQVSLKKLPPVLALQLKRFDHRHQNSSSSYAGNGGGGTSMESLQNGGGKLDVMIRFPLDLDMSSYTTKAMYNDHDNNNLTPLAKHSDCQYTLFAVVVHQGTLHTGHYTSYVRQSGSAGQWFKFDDHMVTLANWSEVSKSQAYMCFYIKQNICYL